MADARVSQESVLTSRSTVVAGLIFAALTLSFLMWMATRVTQIQCSQAALVALVFGLGSALSTSFLGGYAAASGPVTIPYIGDKPIKVGMGGGILALVITTAMAWTVVKTNCVLNAPVLTDEEKRAADEIKKCERSFPHNHIGCVKVKGLLAPPVGEGTLNVRSGPGLLCSRTNTLVNDEIGEVLATHEQWNYVKILSGNGSSAVAAEGWVSVSFIEATPCPGASQSNQAGTPPSLSVTPAKAE